MFMWEGISSHSKCYAGGLLRMKKELVRCAVCGKVVAGKVPAGGDGSVLFPYKHYSVREIKYIKGIKVLTVQEVCEGSYREGLSV